MAKQIANPALPAPPSGKYPAKSHCRRVAKWLAENDGPTEGVIYLEGQALREHEVCCWSLGVEFECASMNNADIDRLGRRHRDALQVSCRLFVFYEAHYQTTGVDSLFQTTSSLLLPHRMRRPGLQLLVRYRR